MSDETVPAYVPGTTSEALARLEDTPHCWTPIPAGPDDTNRSDNCPLDPGHDGPCHRPEAPAPAVTGLAPSCDGCGKFHDQTFACPGRPVETEERHHDLDSDKYTLVVTSVSDVSPAAHTGVALWDVRIEVVLVGMPPDVRSPKQVAEELLGRILVLEDDQ